jgi:[ribosomal protein S5]-alanine N-acetyltransferase
VILAPLDLRGREALRRGDLGDFTIAPGWPHEDTEPGMSFLDSGGVVFLVIDDDGRIIGECGTKAPPGPEGAVEIGYGLAPPSRGRGLGTEAVAALVDWLDECEDVGVVTAEVQVENVASWRVLERLGFCESGTFSHGYRRYQRSAVGHLEQSGT